MSSMKLAFVILAVATLATDAKPSHPFGLHAIPDHFDFAPPVLPPAHFHAPAPLPVAEPAPWLPAPAPWIPAPEPYLPAAPSVHLHSHLIPAAAPPSYIPAPAHHFLPAPAHAHFLPAPVPAPLLPAPLPLAQVLPPVYEALPFAAPTYRAIPGPKTTTHHVSVGYAFPAPTFAKFVAPHAHRAAPLTLGHHLHHHHSLF